MQKVQSGFWFQWGSSQNLLAANNSKTALILCEHVMSAHFSQQVAAVQLTPTQLSISHFTTGVHLALQSDMHIKGVCVTKVRVETKASTRQIFIQFWSHVNRICFVITTGLCDSLEWQSRHCVWAFRNSFTQYRYDVPKLTEQYSQQAINSALHYILSIHFMLFLSHSSLAVPTTLPLWFPRIISLWFPCGSCTWWEPLYCGTEQGTNPHAAGLFAQLCAQYPMPHVELEFILTVKHTMQILFLYVLV